MSTFRLPPPLADSPLETALDPEKSHLGLESVKRYILTSRRDEAQPWVDTEIDDLAVVGVEMDDGFTLWLRGDDLRRELAAPSPRRRDGDGDDKAETESDAFELRRALPCSDAERGVGDWALKALNVFGFKPEELSAEKLAALIDDKNGNQLKHIASPNVADWTTVKKPLPAPTAGQGPLLLFLHGTFSSTEGSFGKLFSNTDNRSNNWETLKQAYPAGIYGFEHRTVGESPIDNLLALVDKLPDGALLHLVSHSRGGLLGDLLALGSAAKAGKSAFSDAQIARFPEIQQVPLRKLGDKLAAKQLRIERFVRVASPSRGTTLASGRMDRWLSVVSHLLSRVPVLGGTLGSGIQEFLLAVVKQRTNPKTLPGLEAMMPSSALVGLLNQASSDAAQADTPLPGTLAVIAGDIEGKGPWGKLKLLLPDLFFDGDHDLVVNTGSMYGGPPRKQAIFLLDRGVEVSHFNYFLQDNTANDVLSGLTRPLPIPGFEPMSADLSSAPAREITRKSRSASDHGRRPVLFVLPGIMGSELSVDGDEVWMSLGRLASGELDRLRLAEPAGNGRQADQDGAGTQSSVTATALMESAYGDLLDYFSDSHDVQPFPYDWRLSIEDSARELADALEPALARSEANGQPLAMLAHSMGGLVARSMIANRPDLWRRIRHHPQGRLVMLGTPNRGSWEIVRLMVGRSSTLKKLALLDFRHNGKALLDIIGAFPGVLELLPDDDREVFSAEFWQGLHQQDEDQRHLWTAPGHRSSHSHGLSRLAAAGEVRRKLRDTAIDPDGMIYVAGQAAATPCEVQQTDIERPFLGGVEGGLSFLASARGDGQVLWDTGLLPEVPSWYMSGVVHGDLANHADAFDALRELVQTGDTHALARQAPRSRGTATNMEMPEVEPTFLPDQRSLLSSALGMGPPPLSNPHQQKIRVTITHGDLATTSRMVAVGHYCGDTIVGPEAYLDRALGGRLRRCNTLGLYPAGIGSQGIYFNPYPHANPNGALVIGLGKVGELTSGQLADTFSTALLAYCHEMIEHHPVTSQRPPRPQQLSITTLLIGTGAGGISVEESLAALLRGTVRTNDRLQEALQPRIVRIADIRVIELWEDIAIQAAHALPQLERNPELSGRFDFARTVEVCPGGKRGPRPHGDPEWWHRLQIVAPEGKPMRFTSLTQRARAEQDLLTTQEAMVDRFVADAISTVEHGRETSRTLYEMLLPNRLKDGVEMCDNLVLVLDERSARFPWEMLEDRWSRHQRPPAIEHGLIRQLTSQTFREQPTMAIGKQALVIGDPQSDFVELPGAREEAEAVQAELIACGYQVKAQINSDAARIVTALHGDAYQIIHLAGHGVHQYALELSSNGPLCNACGQTLPTDQDKRVSGMIIGTDTVLTPADIQQMRRVPELVFINCCHLGRTDPVVAGGAGGIGSQQQFNRLAANLAVQFIRMGVRAVIAAGWAVDDRAASTFASTFYRELMAGRSFGTAVRLAREQTWNESPNINTWGAYQCYGDPDFTLTEQYNQNIDPGKVYPYVLPAEAIAELENLRAEAGSATAQQTTGLLARLNSVEQRIDQAISDSPRTPDSDWRKQGKLAEALGLAHGEMGNFQRAVEYLNDAIAADDAKASCNAVEQRARFHARWALILYRRAKGKRDQESAIKQFQIALDALNGVQLGASGELGVERYRSLTEIYARRVQALPPTERKEDLQALIETYDQAERQLRKRSDSNGNADDPTNDQPGAASDADTDPLDLYSRLLWLAARLLLTGYRKKPGLTDLQPEFDQRCEALAQRTRKLGASDGSFQLSAIRAEVQLLQAVQRGKLTREIATGVVSALRDAMKRGISERERRSMLDNLDLLQTLCRGATVEARHFHSQAEMLAGIRDTLEHGGIAGGG